MEEIPKYSKDRKVRFYESDHKYIDNDNNVLTSVTTVLHKYSNPFDPDGSIARNYAKKNMMSLEQVLNLWKLINIAATSYGTVVHFMLEHYINTSIIIENYYTWIVHEFMKIKFEGKLVSEVLVHSLEHGIAGQVDVVENLGNKVINIWDFKTNIELEKTNKFGQMLLEHLWFLEDCNFNLYELQLSMYAYLCELKGLTINKLIVLYINRDTKQIEQHEVKYRKKEVKEILEKHLQKRTLKTI